jgi:vancomycin resistance protein YoaR
MNWRRGGHFRYDFAQTLKRWVSIVLPIALGTTLGVGGVFAVEPNLPTSPTLRGLRIDGEELALGESPHAWLLERDAEFRRRPVVLTHGELRYEATMGDIGARVDVDAMLEEILTYGHHGSFVKRVREQRSALRGEIDVAMRYTLDEAVAERYVERFADDLRLEPTEARIDLEGYAKVPDVPGRELDAPATAAELARTFLSGEDLLLVARSVPAKVTLHDLDDIDVTKVLSSFETKYAVFKAGRATNVALAASFLNGLVIRPNAIMSFNERVGPRTVARGFKEAPEIVGDELTVGIGGGTCQVSSTLHAAAIYGGLSVVSRKSHTRPSDYTHLGLDATVAYPLVDLKISNPYSFSIVVHAFVPQPGTLRVELLGGEAVSEVEYKYGVARAEDFVRRITVKSWMKPGKAFRKQKGTRGLEVFSYVTIKFNDGRVEKRQYFSGYKPTPEVFWVAPDYNESELPDLPEHAKGVEGRLEPTDPDDIYPG